MLTLVSGGAASGKSEYAETVIVRFKGVLAQHAVASHEQGDERPARENMAVSLAVGHIREREIGVAEYARDILRRVRHFSGGGEELFLLRGENVRLTADERLLAMLPEELRAAYEGAFTATPDEEKLVKAADKLSALRQCIEERKAGNREFLSAEEQTRRAIEEMHLPEADWFMEHCLGAFEKNLDELGTM